MSNLNNEVVDKQLVLEIVKTKLGVDTPPESLLNINIDEVEQAIMNYCNIKAVPKALTYTFANMVCDIHTYDNQVVKDNAPEIEDSGIDLDISTSGINSVRVGNTTVSFGSGSDTSSRNKALRSHQANLDSLLLNYKEQLNKFRKMVW